MAKAEVDLPPDLLFCFFKRRGRAATSVAAVSHGLTEPSNNYQTNRNTRTNTSTHQDASPPGGVVEETEGKGCERGGVGGEEQSS